MSATDISHISAAFAALPAVEPLLDRQGVEQARLARIARDALVSSSPSVGYVGLAAGRVSNRAAVRQWVRRHRNDGTLFSVEHDGASLIPTLQLDQAFDIDPTVSQITKALSEFGLDEWAIWRWWTSENPWIGAVPASETRSGLAQRALDGVVGN